MQDWKEKARHRKIREYVKYSRIFCAALFWIPGLQ